MNVVLLLGIIGKNQYPLCVSDVTISLIFYLSKFSIFNNFLVYSPICMKFAPNSFTFETLSFCLWFDVSDHFPLICQAPGSAVGCTLDLLSRGHKFEPRYGHISFVEVPTATRPWEPQPFTFLTKHPVFELTVNT